MKISFSKYHGTGNDFILVDDRENKVRLSESDIVLLCDRRFGIGADGLILLRVCKGVDFEMIYFNSDGKVGSMCGNGGRCITAFAKTLHTINGHANFAAIDGVHQSIITGETPMTVKLEMADVNVIEDLDEFVYLDTGSPHCVKFVDDVSAINIVSEGRKIRNSPRFREKGTNVNFVQTSNGALIVRTYERGVEDETLSCGTGVTASAIAAAFKNVISGEQGNAEIITPGGKLKVYFEMHGKEFRNVWLEGGVTFVYKGEIEV